MPNYFISNGIEIINFIVAETKEDAELITGATAIQFEDAPEGMNIGWVLEEDSWVNPNPVVITEIADTSPSSDEE